MAGDNKKSLDSGVIAAIITVTGGIVVTLISTFYGNRSATAQATPEPPTAVVYTHTVEPTVAFTEAVAAGDATSTPEPATPAPELIPTATLIPVGADWLQNCLSSLWVPEPSSGVVATPDDKGCLIQPVDTFYTTKGRLGFTFDERISGSKIYGLFAKMPSDGIVSINFHLNEIKTGEVWIGIFAQPDVTSKGALFVIPSSTNVRNQRMILKTMPGQKTFSQTSGPLNSDTATYDVNFDFTSGNVRVTMRNNQIDLESVPVVSGEKWLFLGYQVLNGTNKIQVDFFDLKITPR